MQKYPYIDLIFYLMSEFKIVKLEEGKVIYDVLLPQIIKYDGEKVGFMRQSFILPSDHTREEYEYLLKKAKLTLYQDFLTAFKNDVISMDHFRKYLKEYNDSLEKHTT